MVSDITVLEIGRLKMIKALLWIFCVLSCASTVVSALVIALWNTPPLLKGIFFSSLICIFVARTYLISTKRKLYILSPDKGLQIDEYDDEEEYYEPKVV